MFHEYRDLISELKMSDRYVQALFEKHNTLDQRVKNMESRLEPGTHDEIEVLTGNYWIAGMILVVSTATGGTSRQLANSEPEDLAKILLRNLMLANRAGTPAAVQVP